MKRAVAVVLSLILIEIQAMAAFQTTPDSGTQKIPYTAPTGLLGAAALLNSSPLLNRCWLFRLPSLLNIAVISTL